ncbi:MAG: TfoX/Sxy family protein, partial [Candidatus Altiarchaeota archaeon]
ADDVFYLKVNDTNRVDYESEGMGPFKPFESKKRDRTMPYYEVPADVLESPPELEDWARKAYSVAVSTKKR